MTNKKIDFDENDINEEEDEVNSSPQPSQPSNTNGFDLSYEEGDFGQYEDIPVDRKLRGKRAMNEVFKLVSSKMNRDIVRKNQYMPGAFGVWNNKKSGGNGKYYGGYEDYDKDGYPIEFVVRRGDRNGPIVAVNGYTTTKSDWAAKKTFYENNPRREDRKGKNVKSYMKDEFYKPVYADNGMDVASYTIDPEKDDFTKTYKEKYNLHIPKERSPYRALGNELVYPIIKQLFMDLGKNNEKKAKLYRRFVVESTGNKAFETEILANFYNQTVKDKLLKHLDELGKKEYLQQSFLSLRRERKGESYTVNWNDPESESYKDFERWLFSKKAIKKMIKNYVTPMLTTKRIDYAQKIYKTIKDYIYDIAPDIDNLVNTTYRDYLQGETDRLDRLRE